MSKEEKIQKKKPAQLDNDLLFKLYGHEISKASSKKLKIIQAAVKALAEKGIKNLTLADIATICEMNKGSVHYYFKSMDLLLAACFKYIAESAQSTTVEQMVKEEKPLNGYVAASFVWAEQYPDQLKGMVMITGAAINSPEIFEIVRDVRELGRKRCEKILIQHEGVTEQLAPAIAHQIQILIIGSLVDLSSTNRAELTTYKANCLSTVQAFVLAAK